MFNTIDEVIAANEAIGHCWFSPGANHFFKSRIGSTLYGGKYFITSEKFNDNTPRLYTIRIAKEDGGIETVGKFQQYNSRNAALQAIRRLLKEGGHNE